MQLSIIFKYKKIPFLFFNEVRDCVVTLVPYCCCDVFWTFSFRFQAAGSMSMG